jgi:hypothetical protein
MFQPHHPITEPYSLTHLPVASMWVIASNNLFSLPAPTPTTSFRGAQAIFRAKPFHVQYPTFSTAVTLHTNSPMKMEHTQCSETLAFKLQTPGNNPEESTRHPILCLSLVSPTYFPLLFVSVRCAVSVIDHLAAH